MKFCDFIKLEILLRFDLIAKSVHLFALSYRQPIYLNFKENLLFEKISPST